MCIPVRMSETAKKANVTLKKPCLSKFLEFPFRWLRAKTPQLCLGTTCYSSKSASHRSHSLSIYLPQNSKSFWRALFHLQIYKHLFPLWHFQSSFSVLTYIACFSKCGHGTMGLWLGKWIIASHQYTCDDVGSVVSRCYVFSHFLPGW